MNRTYQNLKLLIEAGRYEVEDMYDKLDLFFAVGRISLDEYIELTGLIEPKPVEEPENIIEAEPVEEIKVESEEETEEALKA